MADIKAQLKRAFLQSLYDAIVDETAQSDLSSGSGNDPTISTLEDALKAFQRLGFTALKTGRLSMGSAGLGHEVRWAPPQQWRSFSQDEVFSMAQEFREVYNDAIVTRTNAGDTAITDLEILTTMMADDRLQTITSTQYDLTTLRWNQRY